LARQSVAWPIQGLSFVTSIAGGVLTHATRLVCRANL
jgi:hypothetical protein